MKRFVPALALILIIMAAGCTNNDENTVNSLPKTHDVFPIFYVKIDNGYVKYGVDSLKLNVEPDIGWESDVYSDTNGFVGTMAAGTYITRIDTIVEIDPDTQLPDTTIDTLSVTYPFQPSATYTFRFTRENDFNWDDSFRAIYAMTIDSIWTVIEAETLSVSTEIDDTRAFDTIIELMRLINEPSDTAGNPPDSISDIDIPVGYWFDTAFALTNPQIEEEFPPDSLSTRTEPWGFWFKVDSFFKATDSILYCDVDSIVERKDTFTVDANGFVIWSVDTVYYFAPCAGYPQLQTKIYRSWGWNDYDTTIHAIMPDTAKSLVFEPDGTIRIINHVTGANHAANLYLQSESGLQAIDSLTLKLTMPPVEVYPFYEILIKDEGAK